MTEDGIAEKGTDVLEAQAPKQIWPAVPATHGGLYSFQDPSHGQRMMAMTLETFLDFRQGIERMRTELTDQKAESIRLFQQTQDLREKLAMTLATPDPKKPTVVERPRLITPGGGEIVR